MHLIGCTQVQYEERGGAEQVSSMMAQLPSPVPRQAPAAREVWAPLLVVVAMEVWALHLVAAAKEVWGLVAWTKSALAVKHGRG